MNKSRLTGLSGDLAEKSPAPIQPLDFIIAYLGLLAGEGGKTVYKRIVCLLAAAVFFMTGLKASAGYYYDRRGRSVAAPDTYVAGGLLDGNALGIGSFDAIGDLYVDGEEALYIADTGNDRVVVLSADDTVRRVVETVETDEGPVPLNAPEGVFYHNGLLYICNTGGGEVLAVDADNRVVRRLGKPESASLSEEAVFKPSKVAVNASGAVFVAASGIYLGLLQYGTDDVFANFFGAAKVEVTPDVVLAAMWKSLFTDAQRESLKREISTEYANLFIDSEDFVFTVTSTVNEKQVSRLNAAGENILKYPGYDDASLFTSGYNRNNFGDQEFDYSKGYKIVSQLTDLHVDAEGILTVLDSRRGKVLQFDSELNPIGVFGGTGDQRGFFRGAAALEKQGEAYLIADGDKTPLPAWCPPDMSARCGRRWPATGKENMPARRSCGTRCLPPTRTLPSPIAASAAPCWPMATAGRRWNTCGRATTGIIIRSPCRNTAGISSGTTCSGCCPPCSPSWRGWLWAGAA